MPFFIFQWTDAIIEHLDEHGVAPEEFADVVSEPERVGYSRSSGERVAEGYANSGRYLFCVYRMIDEVNVEPVTAFELFDDL